MNVKMNWCNFVFFHVSIFVSNYIPLQNSSNPINIKQFKLHKRKYSIDVILLSYYAVMLWFLCKLTYPNINNFHQNLYSTIRGLDHHIMKTKQRHNFVIVCAELAFIYKQHYVCINQPNKQI